MARAMAEGLVRCPDVQIIHPVDGNEVFAAMPDAIVDRLSAQGFKFTRNWRPEPRHHRFVASWASTRADVNALVQACSQPHAKKQREQALNR